MNYLENWKQYLHPQTIIDFQAMVSLAYSDTRTIYPPMEFVDRSFSLLSPDNVKVVIIGQDPYFKAGQANGLAFSVSKGVQLPPSLRNIYNELYNDCKITRINGELDDWARQGVLLINSVLTVVSGQAASHSNIGWQAVTDKIIEQLGGKNEKSRIFVLLGAYAQSKAVLISDKHIIVSTSHPSPLSCYKGFSGSKIFSTINRELVKLGYNEIDWSERE